MRESREGVISGEVPASVRFCEEFCSVIYTSRICPTLGRLVGLVG